MACDVNVNLLRANALVLKERVNAAKAAIDSIYERTNAWIVNNTDAYLPPVTSVKVQVTAYESLVLQMVTLADSLKAIKACELIIPDHIVIPSATGITIPADGSFTF